MKKDVNAIKLAFQLTGDLVERTENKHEYMTRTDKMERINNLIKEVNEKKETWARVKGATDGLREGKEGEAAQSGVVPVARNTSLNDVSVGNEPRTDLPGSGAV